jgi:alginate O-acetyltransferase complex protein AlgI
MLFNSLSFAIFLPIVFILYWVISGKRLQLQNVLLLVSSYFFYACWDWRFVFLLAFSTFLDYITGIKIFESKSLTGKKAWLWISILINLGFLGVFKYYNFFIGSFSDMFSSLGYRCDPITLQIVLPVGISFYTFHGLSYVIDIYKDRIKAERNFVDYAVFVSFFPLLVAGPIERATHLLPQIKKVRQFDYSKSVDGLKQILWGLFKKIVIADNCARFANTIFENYPEYSGPTLLLGALFFTFQIYCDFSGYSDIAIGTAKLFGIDLLRNFAFPYFSRDIAEFWRRWHISLSSWFKDYLYIPLGGSKGGQWKSIRNTLIIFVVSGFWHGANWTFIAWGLLNAIYIMPSIILKSNRNNLDIVAAGKFFPTFKELGSIILTFSLTVLAWIFFRSENITNAVHYIYLMFSFHNLKVPFFPGISTSPIIILLIIAFMLIEWIGKEQKYAIAQIFKNSHQVVRWGFYYVLIILIFLMGGSQQQFIYFQF